jgi:hypothetical protein
MIARTPGTVRLPGGRTVPAVRAAGLDDLPAAVAALGLSARPVVAVVGGADGLDTTGAGPLQAVFARGIVPAVRAHDAIAVDGGTDSGVMRLFGRARPGGAAFPLVGVASLENVTFEGHRGRNPDPAPLEPNHSHFVLVPGDAWGDEAAMLARVVATLAGDRPSATLLINGGDLTTSDAELSLAEGRPVLVLAGTGRLADTLAAAAADPAVCRDPRVARLVRSPLLRVVDAADPAAVAAALEAALTRQNS